MWSEVLDATMCSINMESTIHNLQVCKENFFSDHKYVFFEVDFSKTIDLPYHVGKLNQVKENYQLTSTVTLYWNGKIYLRFVTNHTEVVIGPLTRFC